MDQEKNLENSKKRLKVYYSLLVSVLCFIGVSFALFTLFLRQSDNNAVTALSCFSTTLTEENSAITLTDEYPIPDADGIKKTPFTFKLTNNCDNYVKAYITLDPLKEGTSNYILSKYMKANVSTKGTTDGTSLIIGNQDTKTLENKDNGYIVKEVMLGAKSSKEFDLRLWIDYDTTKEQASGMTYLSQVVIVTEPYTPTPAPNGWYEAEEGTLLASLRDNNEIKETRTVPGKEISSTDEALLASTKDDYGTSYYFRGAVKNNYVQFANKCWRIVRVTGDGSIKMVLHNTNKVEASDPCSSNYNALSASFARDDGALINTKFNENNNDNAYIGLMYGTAGSSNYADTHANINKSTVLTVLETWYENNLSSYENKLADTIWCNDKSTTTKFTNGTTFGSGLGYGTNQTAYGAYNRIYGGNAKLYANPSLICPNDNNGGKLSKFTVSDTTNGNGDLTYKIGMLTADEIAFAGYIYNKSNESAYLNENANGMSWWTISPGSINISGNSTNAIDSLIFTAEVLEVESRLRPAIALVSSIEVSGEGTSENPYIVLSK